MKLSESEILSEIFLGNMQHFESERETPPPSFGAQGSTSVASYSNFLKHLHHFPRRKNILALRKIGNWSE